MSNLAARLLTSLVAVPLLILAIRWQNPMAVWAIVFAVTLQGLREYYRMTMPKEPALDRGAAIVAGLGFAAAVYFLPSTAALLGALAAITLAIQLFYLFRFGELTTVARRIAFALAGILYVALLITFIALMKRDLAEGAAWIFITLTCTWFSDTGAYFAGRFVAPLWPHKLYPAVSPNKTVLGGLGGLAGSLLALLLAKLWYLPALTWSDCLLVAVPANLLGQLGDLSESLLKRSVGVKDSGALLPGHGGILDRIDALLFTSPFIYFYARFAFGNL